MNVVYRVVWNSTTNTWVVASEMAKGRKKTSSSGGATLMVVLAATAGLVAPDQATAATSGGSYLDLCYGGSGTSYLNSGTTGLNCNSSGYGFDLAAGDGYGGYNGWVSLRKAEGYALVLHGVGGVSVTDTMTMNSKRITNLQAGSAGTDAVNVSQLKVVEAKITSDTTDPLAIHYDDATKAKATLGGIGGTTIANLKDGSIASGSKEAVNGGQLFTTNQNVTNLTNNFNTLDTTVDGLLDDALLWSDADSAFSAKHDGASAKITHLTAGAVTTTSTDAINGSQLYGTANSVAQSLGGGSAVNADGTISKPTYKVDGENKEGVQAAIEALDARFGDLPVGGDSLNWDTDASAYNAQRDDADQRITGVADGVNPNDAVNKAQLDKAVDGISPALKYIRFGKLTEAEDGVALAQGPRSTAIGAKATAGGADSFAMGYGARAAYDNSVAVGAMSTATAANTFAVGSTGLKRRIVNVADGIAVSDAATVGQLNTKFAEAINKVQSPTVLKGVMSTGMLGATASSRTPAELVVSGPTALNGATAIGESSFAAGLNVWAEGKYAAAMGQNVAASAENAIGIGTNVATIGANTVAIGSNANTIANNSLVIGIEARIDDFVAENSIAIGQKVVVAGKDTVALGSNIETLGINNVILGNASADDSRNSILSVGSAEQRRQVINVANGTQDFDAVNVSQLKTVAAAIGGGSVVGPDGKVTLPTYKIDDKDTTGTLADGISALDARISDLPGANPLAVVYDDDAKDTLTLGGVDANGDALTDPVKLTNVADATDDTDAVNLGQLKDAGLFDPDTGEALDAVVYDKDSDKAKVTFGGAEGTVLANVAAGAVTADSMEAINGSQLHATNQAVSDIIGGEGAGLNADGTIKAPTFTVGDEDKATVADAIAALDAKTTDITTDALMWDTDAFSAKHEGINAKIKNLAAGTVSGTSTDAINGSQLFATNQAVSDILGGNDAGLNTDGTIKPPTFTVGDDEKATVADALTALEDMIDGAGNPLAVEYDTAAKDTITLGGLNADGTNATDPVKLTNLADASERGDAVNLGQLQDAGLFDPDTGEALDAVVYDKHSSKAKVTFGGATGTVLTNVAPGAVSGSSKDAINGSQLFNTAQSVANALGGESTVNPETGAISKPKYEVAGETVLGVDGAIAALDGKVSDSLQWDNVSKAYSASHDGAQLNKIINVADGTNPNDAINKGQLDKAVDGVSPVLKYIRFGMLTSAEDGNALAQGARSTAVGAKSFAGGADSFAMGYGARAAYDNSVAIGAMSIATAANTFAVGSSTLKRRIVNVADGMAVTDAATVGQLEKLKVELSAPKTQPMVLKGVSAMLGATESSRTPAELIVAGPTALNGATAIGESSLAAGLNVWAEGKYAAAMGQNVAVSAENAVGVGSNVATIGANTVVVGSNANTIANNSLVFGIEARVDDFAAENAIAIGQKVVVAGKDTVAVGSNIETLGLNNVVLGNASADDSRNNIVSVGAATQRRQIINVANGTQDFDAVNVSQLKTVAAAIGGGSVVGPDGKVTLPTYKIDGTDTTGTLADGISALDARIAEGGGTDPLAVKYNSDAKDTLTLGGVDASGDAVTEPVKLTNVADATGDTDAVNLGQLKDAGLFDKETGEALDAVVYDKDSEKAKVTFGGTEGTVLANVAAAAVNADSMEAINGSQLFGTAQSVADALGGGSSVASDGTVTTPTYSVGDQQVKGVEGAVTALDGRVDDVAGDVTTITNNYTQLSGDALKWNASATGGAAYSAAHGTQTESRITNVADATQATDAINKRTFDQAIADISTAADPLSVKYNGLDKSQVTLGGVGADGKPATGPVKLTNVADATGDTDAINLRTLKNAGLVDPGTGKVLDAVVYDANSQRASVTFGGVNGTTLNNVAPGLINADSRQAVNGGQIFELKEALDQQITNIDNRVTKIENGGGGGSAPYIDANGMEGTPSPAAANAGDTPGVAVGYNTDASGAGASAIGDHATAAGSESMALGNNASATEAGTNSIALGNGSIADGANTVSIGSAGHERTISNVARGNADTDAATMGQMRESLTEAKAYTDSRMSDVWSGLSQDIDEVNRQANRGIAAASALINVTPYVPGHVTVNAGLANYRGETALGVGVSRWSDNGRLNLNAGVSAAKNDDPVVRVGIGYIF